MTKLISKNKPISYYGAYSPEQQAYVLPVYKKEGVVLPEVTITPKDNTDLGSYMQNRDLGLGKELASFSPVGDVMDAIQIYKDAKQGNYGQAALGTGLLFLPNIIEKPIKGLVRAGKKVYNTSKDLVWLAKNYNDLGTGLSNPHIRKRFLNVATDPTLTRQFIEKFSNDKTSNIDLKSIKEIYPKLEQLENKYSFTPKYDFNNYTPINDQLASIENTLETSKKFSDNYYSQLEYLKNNNKVLYDIAKESPQYLQQIYQDVNSGKVSNLENYVKSLIEQSGTFIRRMNLPQDADFVKSFGTIAGQSMGHKGYALDVGDPNVVLNSIFSRGYGKDIATYTPKLNLQGPVETWWGQRMPKIDNISINTNGMHTDRLNEFVDVNNISNIRLSNDYLNNKKVPNSYGRTASHMIFTSPIKGTSIQDYYNITPGFNPDLKYTLGYKKGGLIPKKQTGWGTLQYNGPQYYDIIESLKKEDPQAYNRLQIAVARSQQPNSEIVHYKDADGNDRTVTTNKGMSGVDPIGQLYVEGVALNPVFKGLGKAAEYGLAKAGNKWARARILSREINKSNTTINDVNNLSNNNFINKNTQFGKNSSKAIHADYGDNVAGFTKGTTGVSIRNNKLVPGHNPNTDTDYIWWNMDKPYSTGIKGKPFTRYIVKDEKNIPGIINIRKQSKPIGQWNGKSGFVLKSERVTPEQVPLNDASILEYNPITMVYENKIAHPGKQTSKRLIMDDKTIPAYFGKKYSVNGVVNPDGTINVRTAQKIQQETAKHYGVPPMQKRTENPVWHKDDPNTFLHTKKVAKNAWELPVPLGYTKQDQMIAAVGHDFGKMVAGDGHAQAGAGLLKQIFPDLTDDQFKAIYEHMNPIDDIQGNLSKYTKYADIGYKNSQPSN